MNEENHQPLVSVVIATYNYGRFLAEAVHSILGQTYPAREIIIIDDGSTDETADVAASFGDAVRYIKQDNAGVSAARNNGIRRAKGEFVAFLDADDQWAPEKLEKQKSLLDALPDSVALVGTKTWEVFEDGHRIDTTPAVKRQDPILSRLEMVVRNRMVTSSTFMKRECLERVGGFDEELNYCEDWDLWLRIGEHYGTAIIEEPLVICRQHHGSAAKKLERMVEHHMLVFDRHVPKDLSPVQKSLLRRRTYAYILYSSGTECLGTNDGVERSLMLRSIMQHPAPWFLPKRFFALARTVIGTQRWRRMMRAVRRTPEATA